MAKEHHVIIVYGLGDHKPVQAVLNILIKPWNLLGIKIHTFTPGWADGQPFEPKLQKLAQQINHLVNQKFAVSLVGISAGASAALNAYVKNKDKIHKVVFISGKIRHPENVNPRYFDRNPALKQALHLSEANFQKLTSADKQKMIYFHGLYDPIVSPKIDKPAGIRSRAVPAFGHIPGILVAITFYAGTIAKFIKS